MSELYILQNQSQLFLGRQREWLDGRDPAALFKTPHKDEAINQMVEASAKDFTQRIQIVCCESNDKGLPLIDPDILPPPQPKPARKTAATDSLFGEAHHDQAGSESSETSIDSSEAPANSDDVEPTALATEHD